MTAMTVAGRPIPGNPPRHRAGTADSEAFAAGLEAFAADVRSGKVPVSRLGTHLCYGATDTAEVDEVAAEHGVPVTGPGHRVTLHYGSKVTYAVYVPALVEGS